MKTKIRLNFRENGEQSRIVLGIKLSLAVFAFARFEQERDAPYSRECDKCVDNTRDDRTLTSAYPRYNIKFKKPYRAPVLSADYNEYKRYSVKHSLYPPFTLLYYYYLPI